MAVGDYVPVRSGFDAGIAACIQNYDVKGIVYGENSTIARALIATASPGDFSRQWCHHRFHSALHCAVATVNLGL
jgi:hypothetical protein